MNAQLVRQCQSLQGSQPGILTPPCPAADCLRAISPNHLRPCLLNKRTRPMPLSSYTWKNEQGTMVGIGCFPTVSTSWTRMEMPPLS